MKAFLLFIFCPSVFAFGQNYFNVNHHYNQHHSANLSLHLKSDTLVVFGFAQLSSLGGFDTRIVRFIDPLTGLNVRTRIIGDTNRIIGAVGRESVRIGNNFYIITSVLHTDSIQPILQKISLTGDLIWEKKYDQLSPYSVFFSLLALDDSTLIILGTKEVTINNKDKRLLLLDTNGIISQDILFNEGLNQYGASIKPFINETFIATSTKEITSSNYNMVIQNCDKQGNVFWTNEIVEHGYNFGNLLTTNDSLILIFGSFTDALGTKRPKIYLLGNLGNELWNYTLPEYPGIEIVSHNAYEYAIQNSDLSFTLIGRMTNSINNRPMAFIQNITKDGVSKWFRKLKIRTSDNYITDLIKTPNNDYLVSGYVFQDSLTNNEDGWLMRMNCIGLFEDPKDSILLSQNYAMLTVHNFANHFAFSEVNWGDGASVQQESNYADTLEKITFTHSYAQEGNYSIGIKTIACNDTIAHVFPITVVFAPVPTSYNQLTLFPNPNEGNFTVALTHTGLAELIVYDNTGKIVYANTTDLNTGQLIALNSLAKGLYHISVKAEGMTWNTKMEVR